MGGPGGGGGGSQNALQFPHQYIMKWGQKKFSLAFTKYNETHTHSIPPDHQQEQTDSRLSMRGTVIDYVKGLAARKPKTLK